VNTAINIDNEELVQVEWFSHERLVFACLSHMIKDGWVPSMKHIGLVDGNLVARPVKYDGETRFSGVALFKID